MRPTQLKFLPLLLSLTAAPARSEWTALTIPANENPRSLWFTDASTGFMAGISAWRTDDGAATWKKMDIPSGNYYEIRFRDALTGFIAGNGALFKTTDGGNQWQSIGPVSQTFQKIAVCGEVVYGMNSGSRQLWKSNNGGLAWDSLGDLGTTIKEMAFPDSQAGFISNGRDIYKTSDGGKQWRKVFSIRISALIRDMQFLNPDTGYAVGYYPGSILSTYDGGETWKEVSSKFWLYGMHFSDSRHGCVVGSSFGEVMRTTDAGATWVPETIASAGIIRDVHFPAADVGYILGNAAILKFSDPSTSIRSAGTPFSRGQAPIRFFDIRGKRLSPGRHAAVMRVIPGFVPYISWPSSGSIDFSE